MPFRFTHKDLKALPLEAALFHSVEEVYNLL